VMSNGSATLTSSRAGVWALRGKVVPGPGLIALGVEQLKAFPSRPLVRTSEAWLSKKAIKKQSHSCEERTP
jgi:hypothetical protein